MRTRTIIVSITAALLLAGCSSGNVFALTTGDCFDAADGDGGDGGGDGGDGGGVGREISDVPIVDCAEPHDHEVFHTFDLADGDLPGDAAMAAQVEAVCVPAFEEYVGTDYGSNQLEIVPITPTAASWDDGDRVVVCALVDIDAAKLTGSVRGSGQ